MRRRHRIGVQGVECHQHRELEIGQAGFLELTLQGALHDETRVEQFGHRPGCRCGHNPPLCRPPNILRPAGWR